MPYFQATIRNIEYRLRALKDYKLKEFLKNALEDNEDLIIGLVREDQLYERGINGKDISIMDYAPYSLNTIFRKIALSQPHDRVTLKDRGVFYESMKLVLTDEGFYIVAPTYYTPDLLEKYGEAILRLTNENFNKHVIPVLRQYIGEQISFMIKES